MTLTLHILSTGAQAGRDSTVSMVGEALSIGRAETNDLVLPDPNREISSNHAVIQSNGSEYVIIDTSTNGTFLNGEGSPLGNFPSPLNNGDTLRIGPYEMQVSFSVANTDPLADLPPPMDEQSLMPPAAEPAGGGDVFAEVASLDNDAGDFLDGLLGEAPPNAMNTPVQEVSHGGAEAINEFLDVAPDPLLEGGASTPDHTPASREFFSANDSAHAIPDDWDDDLLGGDENPFAPPGQAAPQPVPQTTPQAAPPAQPATAPPDTRQPPIQSEGFGGAAAIQEPAPPVAPPTQQPPAAAAPPPPAAAPAAAGGAADLARAFLKAAGVNDAQIADAELKDIMERSGTVFKTLIEGSREVLMARASIKDELKLSRTMISPDGNNPIKFSISGQQAVEAMIKPTVPGYKPGPESAEEAMNDIKAHEVAMMSGMENAIKTMLGQFNPEFLIKKMEEAGSKGFMKGKKARYWEEFEKLYGRLSEEAEEDFHSLFGKEFGKAYKSQMEKLKSARRRGS